jgi:hypothetical protein
MTSDSLDVVYTYVDPSDPEWKASRAEWTRRTWDPALHNVDSNGPERFDDHNELWMSLCSVSVFAPWVRHVWIVTWGPSPTCFFHLPPHWNVSIHVIPHHLILPPEALPTFNSHVLEAYLTRIPGVSRHFLYFNDDMLLCRPTVPSDWVHPDGTIAVWLDSAWSVTGTPTPSERGFRSAWKNANAWLDQHVGPSRRRKGAHAPVVVDVDAFDTLLRLWGEDQRAALSTQRFRSIRDVNVICSLYPHWMLATGQGRETSLRSLAWFEDDTPDTGARKQAEVDADDTVRVVCLNTYGPWTEHWREQAAQWSLRS